MAEEVKIIIKQEAQGDAISKAQAEIARLKELEKSYRDKGVDSAANSVRSDRTKLETDTNKLIRDRDAGVRAAAKEHLADQRGVTQEMREQGAVAKARRSALARGVQAFESNAGGGGIGGLASLAANPLALAAVAIGTVIGKAVSLAVERADQRDESASRGVATRNANALVGVDSSQVEAEAEASGNLAANRAGERDAEKKTGTFHNTGIMDRLLGIFGQGKADLESEFNELEKVRLKAERPEQERIAREQFAQGTGGAELGAKKAEGRGDRREAHLLRDYILGEEEYARALNENGRDENAAGESARLKVVNAEKRRQIDAASRLVNVRSGNADVVSAAQRAQGGADHYLERVAGAVERLHGTVQDNHREVFNLTRGRKY